MVALRCWTSEQAAALQTRPKTSRSTSGADGRGFGRALSHPLGVRGFSKGHLLKRKSLGPSELSLLKKRERVNTHRYEQKVMRSTTHWNRPLNSDILLSERLDIGPRKIAWCSSRGVGLCRVCEEPPAGMAPSDSLFREIDVAVGLQPTPRLAVRLLLGLM